ncbi:MAG: S8 family peptidase [Pyrinomonadaceae bacterium]
MTLRSGEALSHVPNHLDHLLGAARPAGQMDRGGPIDGVLNRYGGGFRALGVYASRKSLERVGEKHVGFDDLEEQIGLSRTYKVELAETEQAGDVVKALRELANVETAVEQCLAMTPRAVSLAGEAGPKRKLTRRDAQEPRDRIHAPEALRLEEGDERVTVGVVDTGVSLGHRELQRKLLAGYDTVDLGMGSVNSQVKLIGDSRGTDFNPKDEVGHGCHVAGVIAAQGWNLPRGVGGRSLVLPIRVLAAALSGGRGKPVGVGGLSDINAGLKCCVDLGAKVINMSFGTAASALKPGDPLPHARVVDYASRYGCVLVAAAGNSGLREEYYPAALPEVIAIGSVDGQGRRSRFSTYGDHIAVCAPGEQIVSTGRRGYFVSTGTSHAAPFVTGISALLVSRARRAGRELAGADVKRLLVESAAPLGGGGFSAETGYGFLDALAALRLLEQYLASSQSLGRPYQ